MVYVLKYIFVFVIFFAKGSFAKIDLESTGLKSKHLDMRIVGGEEIEISEVPYQVGLLVEEIDGSITQCGGSILNSRYILTAAHCIYRARIISVYVGNSGKIYRGTLFPSSTYDIHPKFRTTGTAHDYDVGYIRTDSDIDIDGIITKAVKLVNANVEVQPGTELLVTGWGLTHENGTVSDELLAVKVPVTSTTDCEKMFAKVNREITDRMICAGYDHGELDSCDGDSGGPAMWDDLQVGIVSFGVGCARPELPGIYVRVSNPEIRYWIKHNTGV